MSLHQKLSARVKASAADAGKRVSNRYVVFSLIAIAGLLVTVWKQSLGNQHWAYPYLEQIATTFLVGGLLGVLQSYFVDRENNARVCELFRIHDSITTAGLAEIITAEASFDYTDMIENSSELAIVLNDGHRWIGNNAVKLSERFSRSGTFTEFFVTDPEGLFVAPLACKTDYEPIALKDKIKRACDRLTDAYENSDKLGSLKIYFLKNYPVQSIFLTENELLLSTYQTSSGRTNPPHLIFEKIDYKDSVHAFTMHDVANLRRESKLAFDSSVPAVAAASSAVQPTSATSTASSHILS
jgi:hypothetical protein